MKRKPRDLFKPAVDASRDLAALIELRDVAGEVVTCQTLK